MAIQNELYGSWLASGSPDDMSALVNSMMPTINSEIQKYSGPKPLLRGKAKKLAIDAVKSYDPGSGASLNSWVVTNLKQLSRYNNRLRPIRAPEVSARQAAEANRVRAEFESDHGRPPTDEELADEIGISVKRLGDIRKSVVGSVNSSMFDAMGTDTAAYQPAVSRVSRLGVSADATYMSLNQRDRMIFDMITGSHGAKETKAVDVARRLGLSPAYVSQRASYIGSTIAGLAGGSNGGV